MKFLIDAENGIIELNVKDEILDERKKIPSFKEKEFGSGALWKFSKTVGSARYGAVTHPGAKKEKENLFRYLTLSRMECDQKVFPCLYN